MNNFPRSVISKMIKFDFAKIRFFSVFDLFYFKKNADIRIF